MPPKLTPTFWDAVRPKNIIVALPHSNVHPFPYEASLMWCEKVRGGRVFGIHTVQLKVVFMIS